MNTRLSESQQCDAVRCEHQSEYADLTLPFEIINWLTGKDFSRLVEVELCRDHWLELEDAVQAGRYERIPTIDPDQPSIILKGMLPMSTYEPFPITEYEYWKQQQLKKGQKYRNQEDKSVYKSVDEHDRVLDDAGMSQRLVAMLVDEVADLSFGPAEEAKHNIKSDLNSMKGITAEVIEHPRADIVLEFEDSLAAGDLIWIGEDMFGGFSPPYEMPIQKPGQMGSNPEWDVNLHTKFDMKDILGYSEESIEKTFRIFAFDPLSKVGFIGMENKYLKDSKAYLSSSSAETEVSAPAVIYSDYVSLPLIESFPEFLSDESSFEEIQNQRIQALNDEIPLPKKSYEYLKAKASNLKI